MSSPDDEKAADVNDLFDALRWAVHGLDREDCARIRSQHFMWAPPDIEALLVRALDAGIPD